MQPVLISCDSDAMASKVNLKSIDTKTLFLELLSHPICKALH